VIKKQSLFVHLPVLLMLVTAVEQAAAGAADISYLRHKMHYITLSFLSASLHFQYYFIV